MLSRKAVLASQLRASRRQAPLALTQKINGLDRTLHSFSKRPQLAASVPSAMLNRNQQRYLITEIVQALASPFETIQQIKDTKKMLEDVKEDFMEQYELSKVPRVNTFEPLSGFYPRPRETEAIKKSLNTQPAFMIIFGSSSVGKTALLREVLANPSADEDDSEQKKFIVMHIDLRIAGFADLTGLAIRLASQFELFFETIMTTPEEDGIFKKEEDGDESVSVEHINAQYAAQYKDAFKGHMLAFRQLRKQFENRMEKAIAASGNPTGLVTIGDIASIMERFQSSLVAYWQFEVSLEDAKTESERQRKMEAEQKKKKGFLRREKPDGLLDLRALKEQEELEQQLKSTRMRLRRKTHTMTGSKRVPVILIDEAHRLPALIDSQECIKTLLDSFLVLTKQDRLCHVIHTTSDPFYLHWLRALNVAQHTKIVTVQDCTFKETEEYYYKNLLPATIEQMASPGLIKQKLPEFPAIWEVFGGRLAHISDYIAEFMCSNGHVSPQQSSHFTQAYANVQIHLTHHAFVTHASIPDAAGGAPSMAFDVEVFAKIVKDLLKSKSPASSETSLKYQLDYFATCDKYGAEKVNAIVGSRLLDIVWSPPAPPIDADLQVESKALAPQPANKLAHITPPKLIAMSRVIEHAMEVIMNEQST